MSNFWGAVQQRRRARTAGTEPILCRVAAVALPGLRFVLCAPRGIRDITQKINRERNLPGINIEVVALPNVAVLPNIVRTGTFPVAPLFCRVAAGALPGLQEPLTGSHLVGPVSAAPPGDAIRHGAAFMPGGGWRLTRPTHPALIVCRPAQAHGLTP